MRELIVFGIVGGLATATHYLSALGIVEFLRLDILLANVLAYCVAVGVSYVGHSKLTFKAEMTSAGGFKFVIVSLSALALSQVVLAVLTKLALFDYKVNMLVVVGIIPIYSFILNKFWVYKAV